MKILKKMYGENARMYARRVILDNIINLELPPGSVVSENELSAALQLSRTPVREALIEMSRLSLVEIVPQRGSYVTKIDYDLIEDAKFIRLSLELAVARLICQQGISETDRGRLKDSIGQQRKCVEEGSKDQFRMLELDNDFHKMLFGVVHKQRAYEFLHTQMLHFDRLRILSYKVLKSEKSTQTLNDHENIVYALEKQDLELAEMVMTQHLTRHQVDDRKELEKCCPEYFL